MKIKAVWLTCADLTHSGETEGEHMMKDNCWNCAPFWWKVPTCPHCVPFMTSPVRLNPSGYCKMCKKFADVSEEK